MSVVVTQVESSKTAYKYCCYIAILTSSIFLTLVIDECDECPSYQIIGDIVDLHQRTFHQSMERKDKDHHLYAVRDRVTGCDSPNDAPIADVGKVLLQTFLPSVGECNHPQEEFRVLIARVIIEKLLSLVEDVRP